MKLKYLLFIGSILGLGTSCKIYPTAFNSEVKVPESYNQQATDSVFSDTAKKVSSGTTSWKIFFTDDKLKNLIDTALIYNFDTRTAFANMELAKSQLALTSGIRLPNLGIGIGAGIMKYGEYTEGGLTNFSESSKSPSTAPIIPNYDLFLSTSWEIDLWGKLKNKKRSNIHRFMASEEMRKLVFTSMIAKISESYYNLMILDQQIAIYSRNLELQENALDIVKFQKEGGKVTELAVELIHAQYLHVKSYLLDLQREVIFEENKLNLLLGRYPTKISRNVLNENTEITQYIQTGLPSEILQNRPDIRAAEQYLRAENANILSAKAAFYPQLTINAKVGLNAFRANYWLNPASFAFDMLGGLFTPLLNRRELKYELLNSKANQSLAYIHYEKTIVNAFTEVSELIKALEITKNQITIKKNQVETLNSSINTSQELFLSGRAGYLEILTAQENYLKALNELQELSKYKNVLSVRLFKAIGGGSN